MLNSANAVRTVRSTRVGVTRCHASIQSRTGRLERSVLRMRVHLRRQRGVLVADPRRDDRRGNALKMHQVGAGMSRRVQLDVPYSCGLQRFPPVPRQHSRCVRRGLRGRCPTRDTGARTGPAVPHHAVRPAGGSSVSLPSPLATPHPDLQGRRWSAAISLSGRPTCHRLLDRTPQCDERWYLLPRGDDRVLVSTGVLRRGTHS
jgi:hypothetical protein